MIKIDSALVTKLINEQFQEWAHLEIKPVKLDGHDNRTFHLGNNMSVRLPSASGYVPQVKKEQKWLPILAQKLSVPISSPIAKGEPNEEYPFPWSINKWLDGETVTRENVKDLNQFAKDLGEFLIELQSIDASEGPVAGAHNFYRGAPLSVYDHESRNAIEKNRDVFDKVILTKLWDLSLDSKWEREPVWLHGDIAVGNILVQNGKLSAVIDFGILGVGDPSCDAAMAWTFFDNESRTVFKDVLKMDERTWNRARGWALWKALITYEEHKNDDIIKSKEAYNVILTIVEDFKINP
ncbi:aminoglycoside phosphotransferase family protein [Priestia taiwanensis]|uniref:Acetyltransferase n=1 Tax=Priestia taiwanensis TaxID=1347902 RepID=A0A917EKP5_9BACI|nr:aminoglycoside phosphotransferase family protein [Priestia taiwanensis]MBM7361641.1 aminoglycoside phosphotransferase (APT) family kinase protein [Priestia taiwanensis]GGE55756.1 acetyltransferase [Priestia taiwanensis]